MAKVKICGLSTDETMQGALDADADFVGLVFFAKSPRHVSVERAATLAEMARGRAEVVALVVDADDTLLSAIAKKVRPDYIQAHGNETPQRVADIRTLTGVPVIKVISVADAADVALSQIYKDQATFILFDTKTTGPLPGGMGHAFDWSLLSQAAHPYMLAGGLTPETVASAIAQTGAQMVDVSSGVESAPGVKDVLKIRKFIAAAR
jgi:phosphoribosylanthranilate isomerase